VAQHAAGSARNFLARFVVAAPSLSDDDGIADRFSASNGVVNASSAA
jgi:hypothetical protein